MPKRSSKKPSKPDVAQIAHALLQRISGEEPPEAEPDSPKKNPAAVALGKLGGAKGGKARARKLSAKQRAEIAKKAARARWGSRRSAE
jgi:hypothetical protein